jgi:hypothetical protein
MADKEERICDGDEDAMISNIEDCQPGGGIYQIRIRGQLDESWSEWLEGLEVKLLENGEMLLFGPIVDQPALMGVLLKLSRLNLELLSVNCVKEMK